MTDPRIGVSQRTHARVKKLAKKNKVTLRVMGEKVATAGLKALAI